MSTVKSFKIGNTSYPVEDDDAIKFLTAAQRTQLLADGTYNGTAIASGTCFVTDVGTVEQFTITGGGSSPVSNLSVAGTGQPPGVNGSCIAYGNNMFLAIDDYDAKTSTDGITWTTVGNCPTMGGNMSKLYFVNGYFIAVDTLQEAWGELYRSADGVTWTTLSLPFTYYYDYVRACNDCLFAISSTDKTVVKYSADAGSTWSDITSDGNNIILQQVLYCDGKYLFFASPNGGYCSATNPTSITYNADIVDGLYGCNAPDGSWALMNDGNSWRYTTNGTTWSYLVDNPPAISYVGSHQNIGCTPEGVAWVADPSGQLLYVATDSSLSFTGYAIGSNMMAFINGGGSVKLWISSSVSDYGESWIMTYDGGSSGPSYSLTPLTVPAEVVEILPVSPTSGKVYFVTGSA